jgi:hypothetical protein
MADEVQRTLGRIESKLDSVLEKQDEHKQRLDNHGARIGGLERWRAWTLGAAVAIGAMWSLISTLVHGN